jgi:hypothetical protein
MKILHRSNSFNSRKEVEVEVIICFDLYGNKCCYGRPSST